MTTIKLIPSVMEFDVSLDSASMPSLFSQSLETTIITQIEQQVNGRIATAEDVSKNLAEDRDFCRKIRDWMMDSLDTYDIVDSAKNSVLENLDTEEIAQHIMDSADYALMKNIMETSKFQSMMRVAVSTILVSSDFTEKIEETIEQKFLGMVGDIADNAVKIINNRLTGNNDI
jgi:copper chaperone CopZ